MKPTEYFEDDEPKRDYIIEGDYSFEKIIVDADTMVFQSSLSVQETYIVIEPITDYAKKVYNLKRLVKWGVIEELKEEDFKTKADYRNKSKSLMDNTCPKELKNKTMFWGHHSKKEGGVLANLNFALSEADMDLLKPEDFEITEYVRLIESISDPIEYAVSQFDHAVGRIKRSVEADSYLLCIGGKGNYRYDLAHTQAYKGERKEKPILFAEIRQAIIDKYAKRVEICDGIEADDRLGHYGFENLKHFEETGQWKYCLSFVDKDICQVPSPFFRYSKIDEGITIVSKLDGARFFCTQLLCGDRSVDNIRGLPSLSKEFSTKHNLRKVASLGKATAQNLLEDCETSEAMFKLCCEAYIDYYPEPVTFTSHRGEELTWSWLDFMQETGILIYMQRKPNDMFNIRKVLRKMKLIDKNDNYIGGES